MGKKTKGTLVMISHSSADKDAARTLALLLAAEGISVWFDEWEIAVGDSIPKGIESALRRSSHVVLLWSKAAKKSRWVTAERRSAVQDAIERKRPKILPILLDDTARPKLLNHLRFHRWLGGTDDDRDALVEAITGRSPSGNLLRAFVSRYHDLISAGADPDDPFQLTACPRCGSTKLRRGAAEDTAHDRVYYMIRCEEPGCGFGDWTE